MRLAQYVPQWTLQAEQWLATKGFTREQVITGRDAWTVAHNANICREAYDLSRDITDGHIQTALERIFPNANFRDAKRY